MQEQQGFVARMIFPLKRAHKPSFDLVAFLVVLGFVNNCPNTALVVFRTEFINPER